MLSIRGTVFYVCMFNKNKSYFIPSKIKSFPCDKSWQFQMFYRHRSISIAFIVTPHLLFLRIEDFYMLFRIHVNVFIRLILNLFWDLFNHILNIFLYHFDKIPILSSFNSRIVLKYLKAHYVCDQHPSQKMEPFTSKLNFTPQIYCFQNVSLTIKLESRNLLPHFSLPSDKSRIFYEDT